MSNINIADFENLEKEQKAKIRRALDLAVVDKLSLAERITIWFFGTVIASIVLITCAAIVSGSWINEIYNGQLLISAVGVLGAAASGSYL